MKRRRVRGQYRGGLRQHRRERVGGADARSIVVRGHCRVAAPLVIRHQAEQIAAQSLVRLRLGVRRRPVDVGGERLHRRRGQLERTFARATALETFVLRPVKLDRGYVGRRRRTLEETRSTGLHDDESAQVECARDDGVA